MARSVLFFDFDGVIADSFATVFSINRLMRPAITPEQYRRLFEGNVNESLEKAVELPPVERPELDFATQYAPRLVDEVPLFPGAKHAVARLAARYRLAIISSTESAPIRRFLAKHGMDGHFERVLGNDVHKSKVEKMRMFFAERAVGAQDCVFVTDTLGDVREAARLGVPAVAVAWGYHPAATLARGNPFATVESMDGLIPAVDAAALSA